MSINFERCFRFVLQQEGGFCDHPLDKGGATNYGLSERFLNAHGITKKVTELTVQDAKQIYYTYIWIPCKAEYFDELVTQLFIFDCSVNCGIFKASSLFQEGLNFILDDKSQLDVDGIIGAKTIAAYKKVVASGFLSFLLNILNLLRGGYYLHIATRDKTQKLFLRGWINRNSDVFNPDTLSKLASNNE